MNICLVTAPIATEFHGRDEIETCLDESAISGPQLGVLSLAAVLEARGDDVRIVDLDHAYLDHLNSLRETRQFVQVAARVITANGADVYGFSSICSSYPLTIRIAQAVKAVRPNSIVLVGGPQASVVDRQTLAAFPSIDFILRGEAEFTLPLLLDALDGKAHLAQIPGLTYRWQYEPHRNANAPVIENLDSFPRPAYHLVGGLNGATKASVELGRGCPFACTFCSTNDFFRRKFRLRAPERIIDEMRVLAAAYGIREFELVHDMFTIDRRRVASFCEAMLASGDGFMWSCSARTDCVDEELLELMSRAGCTGIFFGVETGSPKLQKIIDKHLDLGQAAQIIAVTECLGISCTVSLITGFPEETWEDLQETVRMFMVSARCSHSTPQLNILAPLADTPLYLRYRDQLTLGGLCSDMSQQGICQDAEDLKLIDAHPEIFPNFYLVPTPYLDRECLLELREFALNSVGHFRWLLCAIDQSAINVLEFFLSWRTHRFQIRSDLKGPDLRRYYRTERFRQEWLSFVRSSPAGDSDMVKAFLEFEDAWKYSSNPVAWVSPDLPRVIMQGEIRRSDVPLRSNDASFIELSFDIQSVINALKRPTQPVDRNGSHFYIAFDGSDGAKRLHKVSPELGRLLRACDGRFSIQEVIEKLTSELGGVEKSPPRDVLAGLLEAAKAQGLIEVYRPIAYHSCIETEGVSARGTAIL